MGGGATSTERQPDENRSDDDHNCCGDRHHEWQWQAELPETGHTTEGDRKVRAGPRQ